MSFNPKNISASLILDSISLQNFYIAHYIGYQYDLMHTKESNYIEMLPSGLALEMIKVPGGVFMMGSDADDREQPIHQVQIPDFYLGKYPVTNGQYMQFVKATKSHYPEWMEEGNAYNVYTGTDDHYKKLGIALTKEDYPIVGVSWDNALAFCQWLSELSGKTYRLPSETEWEFAARGGNQSLGFLYSGSNKLKEVGWYRLNSHGATKPVGLKLPNELGIYDLSGNVWEWCADHWHDNYQEAPEDGSAWVEMENFLFLLGRKGRDTFMETIPNNQPDPNNSKRMNEINKLVSNNRLKEALDVLLQLAPLDQKNQVSLLQRELKALNSQRIIGVLSHKEENLSRNSLASRILELASSFKEENQTIAPEHGREESSPQINLAPLKNNPPKAFISYAHKEDSRYFKLFAEGVKVHSDWDIFTDRDILIGEDWHERLQQEVKTCDFAIFLLSPYFFRSDYIKKHEFERFIERNVADGFPFFSVLLADCDFQKWEAIARRQIFVAHGQDYNLVGPHRDKQISFDRLVHYNQTNGELVPNSYRNTYYKNFVQAVNEALQR